MKAADFDSMMRGLAEAKAFIEEGARDGYVIHEPIDVKAVRAKTKLSQAKFARTYRVSVKALKEWEQGRRTPDQAAQTLYTIIDREPQVVADILARP